MHYLAKSLTALTSLVSVSAFAESEEGDRLGFGIYRLALTIDAGTVALYNYMFLASVVLMLAAVVVWGTGHKNNLPKQTAAVLAGISLLLASPTLYQQIAAKTFLNSTSIDAIEFLENDGKVPMNEEVY